jgi:hypothetical protein
MQDLLTKVMPGCLVVGCDRGRGASVRRRRTSRSTGAEGDTSLESECLWPPPGYLGRFVDRPTVRRCQNW